VVKVRSNVRDHTRVGDYSIDWKTRDFRGNFVIIKHAEKEYSFIAHLKKDSVAVKAGDKVKQGQVIGLCGNSGHSTEPHIHFHLQDSSSFWIAAGLPVRFGNFSARAPGKETEEVRSSSFVSKNEIVKNL
jgi:murein DD-endopeptidase MepM/ murein hydrolase activator NlpD